MYIVVFFGGAGGGVGTFLQRLQEIAGNLPKHETGLAILVVLQKLSITFLTARFY